MECCDPPKHPLAQQLSDVRKHPPVATASAKRQITNLQVTAYLTPILASWPKLSTWRAGRRIESGATIRGTGHQRVQCPIVLSPHPQARQTTSEVGTISQDCCHSRILSIDCSLVYAWSRGRLHGTVVHKESDLV